MTPEEKFHARIESFRKLCENKTKGRWVWVHDRVKSYLANSSIKSFHTDWFPNRTDQTFISASSTEAEFLLKALEIEHNALISITKTNFAGPSTDERREWTWAKAHTALTEIYALAAKGEE